MHDLFPYAPVEPPYISTEQMIEVDRAMIEDYGILLMQMMENAGRCLAHLARARFFAGDPRGRRVLVMAGTGGNGGGALVCARRLHNYGADVSIVLSKDSAQLAEVPAHQLNILNKLRVPVLQADALAKLEVDLIVDGLIGYSLKGTPRGQVADLIIQANESGVPILSLDTPSGVDAGSGQVYEPSIRALATLTLALPKRGFRVPAVQARTGELYLADISVPPQLYSGPGLGLDVAHLFAESDIIRL